MSRKDRKRRQQVAKKNDRKRAKREVPTAAEPPYHGRKVPLERIDESRWRIPRAGLMRTDGIVYAREDLLPDLREDRSLEQVANVATLPGIVGSSLAMPDIHWGYGFPIGGVAAFDPATGIVSPGGVGYDINCGVRLLATNLEAGQVKAQVKALAQELFDAIPAGVGASRPELRLDEGDQDEVLARGLEWARERGLATDEDVARVEEGGVIPGADPRAVSDRARARGRGQLGTLGSGNHFVEVGVVDQVHDEAAAEAYGLRVGLVTLMIHSGSRGLGHQVCEDALETMIASATRHRIPLVDRQLCCAPIDSPEAKDYLAAMAAAANFAFVNRQVMTHWARDVFKKRFKGQLRTVYDVCHNIAKFEEHVVPGEARGVAGAPSGGSEGRAPTARGVEGAPSGGSEGRAPTAREVDGPPRRLLVHRKGATRALPPGHALVPAAYRAVGQPVVIPGDMGRYSFVLRGAAGSAASFGSACHGAGRLLSRSEAQRRYGHQDTTQVLADQGVIVIGASRATVVEEVPQAYKDVAQVVDVVARAGLADIVARIRPIAVVKG